MGGRDNRGFILIGQGKGKERIQTGVGRVGCPNPNLISGGVGFEIKKNRGSKGTIGIDRKEMAIGGLIIVEEAEGDQGDVSLEEVSESENQELDNNTEDSESSNS